jgi:hypothetical protein
MTVMASHESFVVGMRWLLSILGKSRSLDTVAGVDTSANKCDECCCSKTKTKSKVLQIGMIIHTVHNYRDDHHQCSMITALLDKKEKLKRWRVWAWLYNFSPNN